jgi:SAM-dependent methyltransferase
MTNQEKLFLLKEADKYFERNTVRPNKYILNAIKFLKPGSNEDIFEIGCSSGATLNKIAKLYSSNVYGLDPSKKAIIFGKKKFRLKNIHTNTFLNFKSKKKFDIIINGGFLYLTPNNVINKTLLKIFKTMKVNSYFIFWDYDTPFDYINDWKYNKGVKSYKRNYLKLINKLNNNLYLISKKQFIIGTGKEIKIYNKKIDIDEVITTMIFKKIK